MKFNIAKRILLFNFFIVIYFFACQDPSTHNKVKQKKLKTINNESSTNYLDKLEFRKKTFKNVSQIFLYKNHLDSLLHIYLKSTNHHLSNFEIDSFYNRNQELCQLIVFEHLKKFPKNEENFQALEYVINANNITEKQKNTLFHLYPISLIKSRLGNKYFANINKFSQNIGKDFPCSTKIQSLYGNKINASSLFFKKYNNYLIFFTATWCGPCRIEENSLKKAIAQRVIDTTKVKIYSVYLDKNFEKWKRIKNEDLSWEIFRVDKEWNSYFSKELKLSTIPHFYYLSSERKILKEDNYLNLLISK